MSKPTIVSMPGDGIGKVVLPAAIEVLEKVGFDADYVHADIGWEFWCKEGNPLPERTIDLLKKHKIGLFGAITSKPKTEAAKELAPELQDKGYSYFSPIVGMRQMFHLDLCIRPCKSFKGNPLNFIRRGAGQFNRRAGSRRGDLPTKHGGPLRRRGVDRPPRRTFARHSTPTRNSNPLRTYQEGAGDLDPHLHPGGVQPNRRRGVQIRQEIRIQIGHHLRKTQRHQGDLRDDAGDRPQNPEGLSRHRTCGTPISTRR